MESAHRGLLDGMTALVSPVSTSSVNSIGAQNRLSCERRRHCFMVRFPLAVTTSSIIVLTGAACIMICTRTINAEGLSWWVLYGFSPVCLVASSCVTVLLLHRARTSHLLHAALFSCSVWASNLFHAMWAVLCPSGSCALHDQKVAGVCGNMYFFLYRLLLMLQPAVGLMMVNERNHIFDDNACRRVRIHTLTAVVAFAGMVVVYHDQYLLERGDTVSFYALLGFVVLYTVLVISEFHVLTKVLRNVKKGLVTMEECESRIRAEQASRAVRSVSQQRCGLIAMGSTTILCLLTYGINQGTFTKDPRNSRTDMVLQGFCEFLASIGNTLCTFTLSGGLGALGRKALRKAESDNKRRDRQMLFSRREQRRHRPQSAEDEQWEEKVGELSRRGFTLEALLHFYEELPTHMPHFDPKLHTTADVVREAIIELSFSDPGKAYATIMMNGGDVTPDTLVTHNWSNIFSDLVSAIVADALGEHEYAMIAYWLRKDVNRVREWVAKAGRLGASYWVCAFSVAQHRSICHTPSSRRDPVTGDPHPICGCTERKCFGNTEPCRGEQSIPCEMNKFEDVMRCLARENRQFRQLIACDANFKLFGRAWCAAESNTAFQAGIWQYFVVKSGTCLQLHSERLKQLDVNTMEASRQEDRDQILRSIPSTIEFNRALQELIFDEGTGLLGAYKGLDTVQLMHHIRRIAHWVSVGAETGDTEFWRELGTCPKCV
eukprot:NODE_187_length_3436_cov_6.757933.p1 GENE.NODE_187_length_3436_cov_6.757933~~NODE_187_length_3436_cov_6.757933.p1  ORF type:complete len:717 (+),score=99.63 NODE_187_length_3436_cov_6.757933:644-2794(+)